MRKILLSFFLIVFFITGCGDSKDSKSLDDFKNDRTIIIGLDDSYPPFGFRNEKGELVGFDIDFANEVASRMGISIEFKGIDWNSKYDEIENGRIDLIWSGFNVTSERKEHVIFSKPYMINRQVILVKKGQGAGIISAADLAGKVVGTQLGSLADFFINQDEKLKNSFAKLITYDNYEHVFKALAAGEVDAVVCDELVVHYEMNRHHDKFDTVEATVGTVTDIAVGFRKNDTALRDKFQKVFDEMADDGTTKEISEKWFGADLIKNKK